MKTMVTTVVLAVIMPVLSINAALADAVSGLVAQPKRALTAEWKVPEFAGRDFWIMLDPSLREMEGIKQESFIRESGLAGIRVDAFGGLVKRNLIPRMLAVREIEVVGTDGKNLAPTARVEAASTDKDVELLQGQAACDGDYKTLFVGRGDETDKAIEYQPIAVQVTVQWPVAQAAHKVVLASGVRGVAEARLMAMQVRRGGQWAPAACVTQQVKDRLEMTLAPGAPFDAVRLVLASKVMEMVLNPDVLPEKNLMTKFPFMFSCRSWRPGIGTAGWGPAQFDQGSFRKFLAAYERTFLGFWMPEWDAGGGIRPVRDAVKADPHHAFAQYLPPYTNRVEAYASVERYFRYYRSLFFDSLYSLSGNITWPQYAAEWGSKTLGMSVSGSHPNLPTRSCILFTRSAARQYGLPWLLYVTSFYPPGMAHPTLGRPECGKPASLSRREYFSAYYQGATFIEPEASTLAIAAKAEREKTYRLSRHGQTLSELHDWSRKAEGARGTSYTPVLFLADICHGRGGRRGFGGNLAWKVWNDLEMEDGDYMIEHAVRTVDRFVDSFGDRKELAFYAPFSNNMRNSQVGDCVDIFFANPPSQGGVVKKEHVDNYAVVMLLGEMRWTPALEARLKNYVKEGGTLVINSAQCAQGMAEAGFLGVKVGTNMAWEDNMQVVALEPVTAEVVMKTSKNTPLLTKNKYGQGHVLVTSPRYLLLKEKTDPAPLVEDLLVRIQDEVLPVKVEGNCQFMLNRAGDGRWMAVLINNEGVIKDGQDDETFFLKSYLSPVTLTAPAGASAREVLAGAALEKIDAAGKTKVRVVVPPGEVRVVEFKGL